MREAGFDVSVLFGIPDFYPKFGYAVCMAECSCTVATRHAERASPAFGLSPASEPDGEPVRRLYEEANSSRTGSIIRKEARWKDWRGSRWKTRADCFVARDPSGNVQAYAVLDEDAERTVCSEVAAGSPEGYEPVLRFLAEDAVAKRAGDVRVICPYDHPFLDVASRFGARVEIMRPRCGGVMGRVVNQRSLLEKLLPLFSARLRRSELSGSRFAVGISTELGRTTIAFDGTHAALEESGAAESCELPAPALMQVVMGYRSPRAAWARIEGERCAAALEIIFPRQQAHTWHPDRF